MYFSEESYEKMQNIQILKKIENALYSKSGIHLQHFKLSRDFFENHVHILYQ